MTTYMLADGWEDHTDELTEWAAANGLNAALIPNWSPVTVDGEQLTVQEVIPGPDGITAVQYVDSRPITRPRTVPLAKAPDPELWVKV